MSVLQDAYRKDNRIVRIEDILCNLFCCGEVMQRKGKDKGASAAVSRFHTDRTALFFQNTAGKIKPHAGSVSLLDFRSTSSVETFEDILDF